MGGYPETKFSTKRCPYKETFFEQVYKSVLLAKKNTGRRFLKEFLASYEQKKKSEVMR